MSDMLELAARCEAADGPDRELDVLIWRTCRPDEYTQWEGDQRAMLSRDFDEAGRLTVLYARTKRVVREFTASLDAALTLVPEGWTVANLAQSDRKCWWAELRRGYLTSFDKVAIGNQLENYGPAIALVAAALRARAHIQENK